MSEGRQKQACGKYVQSVVESIGTITKLPQTTMIRNHAGTTTSINIAPIPRQLIKHIMKSIEWTPKRRSRALGLTQGGRHSLSEITKITNIPKGTLGNLRKRNNALNKPRSGRSKKLTDRHKRQIVFHITRVGPGTAWCGDKREIVLLRGSSPL